MAKRKISPKNEEVTILVKPREVFKKQLEERIALGKEFIDRNVTTIPELEELQRDFGNWDDFNEELLKRSFNKPQNEYFRDYNDSIAYIGFDDVTYRRNTETGEYKLNHEKKKARSAVLNLERLVEKLPLIDQDENIVSFQTVQKSYTNSCFIVHGHDEARKYEIARFIENDLHRRTIILHEQPNKGKTIIEKFETYSKVDFAVALWTADDDGKSKKESDLKSRARQNVILETGFFLGALGRENVIVLYEDGVEIPSDYSGVIFIKLDGNWKDDLRKEIAAIYDF